MLEVDDLHAYYAKSHILQGVSFRVGAGEIVSLLGRNGAGRSTAVKTIVGLVPPVGVIRFRGERIDGLAPHEIARKGLGYVPEGREIFPTLTVRQNLLLGMKSMRHAGRWPLEDLLALFPLLRERIDAPGGVLSGGEQQMLAIGRCLAGQPELIMFDEPSLGLAPVVVQEVLHTIRLLNQRGITILLVEQNVAVSLKISNRAYVLENGRIVMSGSGDALLHDSRVRQAYLGL